MMEIHIKKGNIIETDDLPVEKLQELKDQLEVEIGKMEADIFEAKVKHQTTGEYADPDWFKRIHMASKVSKLNKEKLNRAIADRKKAERKSASEGFERVFMQVTFEMLGVEKYRAIKEEAHRRIDEAAPSIVSENGADAGAAGG